MRTLLAGRHPSSDEGITLPRAVGGRLGFEIARDLQRAIGCHASGRSAPEDFGPAVVTAISELEAAEILVAGPHARERVGWLVVLDEVVVDPRLLPAREDRPPGDDSHPHVHHPVLGGAG